MVLVAIVLFSAIGLMHIWRFVCRITIGEGGRRGKDEAGRQEQRGEKEGREGKQMDNGKRPPSGLCSREEAGTGLLGATWQGPGHH